MRNVIFYSNNFDFWTTYLEKEFMICTILVDLRNGFSIRISYIYSFWKEIRNPQDIDVFMNFCGFLLHVSMFDHSNQNIQSQLYDFWFVVKLK